MLEIQLETARPEFFNGTGILKMRTCRAYEPANTLWSVGDDKSAENPLEIRNQEYRLAECSPDNEFSGDEMPDRLRQEV